MESVGHSRLLKFLVNAKKIDKMEAPVYVIEYEYITPTNIESEVPDKHDIREGDVEIAMQESNATLDDKIDNPGDYVLSPVITVTKQESEFTKGDLKLQKVSVTENISDHINGTTELNPNIHADVIEGPQPVRVVGDDGRHKTRIPTLKFRQAAEAVRESKQSEDKKDEAPPTRLMQKRSSIPRLKDSRIPAPLDRRASKSDIKVETPKPEDEFEKIYDEIIDCEPKEMIRDTIENIKIEDPDKLENKFEEIIHDYEENKVHPITVDVPLHVEKPRYSKIPLSKRKSDQDIKIPKPVERTTVKSEKHETRIPLQKDLPHKAVRTKYNLFKTHDKSNDANLNKLATYKQIPTENQNEEIVPVTEIEPLILESKVEESVIKEDDKSFLPNEIDKNSDIYNEIVRIDTGIFSEPIQQEKQNEEIVPVTEIERLILESKVEESVIKEDDKSFLPNEIDKNSDIYNEIVRIDTGIFSEPIQQEKQNEEIVPVTEIEPLILESKVEESVIKEDDKSFLPKEIDENSDIYNEVVRIDTGKLSEPIQQENEVTLDEITNNSNGNVNKTNPTANFDHEIKKVNGTIRKYSKEYDSRDNMDNEYKPGKVSRLLQRIQSQEFGINNNSKKEIPVDVPNKKSVLSKIAMFETQDSEKDNKKILNHSSVLKPKELKSPVIDRTPIIVDELLKEDNKDLTKHYTNNENILPENMKNNVKKDFKVEIEDEKVKYHEIYTPSKSVSNDNDDLSSTIESVRLTNKSKLEPHDTRNEIVIPKPICRELLEPPSPNIDEKVPRNVVIETLEHTSTEYEIPALIIKKEEPINTHHNNIKDSFDISNFNDDKKEIPVDKISIQETVLETAELKPVEHLRGFENNDDVFTKDSKIEKWKRLHENGEIKRERPKSVAEVDLGDVMKGKVHQMIVRMNSVEKIETNKKEIDPRERPRKKSVSNIIAFFEQKFVLTETPNHRPVTPKLSTLPAAVSDEEYQRKAAELASGKLVYGRVDNMTYIVLSNGVEMPVLAVGTATIDKRLVRPVIEAAIDLGYRAIDTAYIYGNEREVGEAIRAKIEDGTVTREDLFIISKLWSTFHRSDLVSKACQASLEAMGLSYFDLYLIHNPMSFKEGNDPIPKIANVLQYSSSDFMDAWYGMERLVSKGLVKSIGVSNFNSHQIQRVLDKARVKPVINQVECHPYLSQERLGDYCSARDVILSCFGVLGSKGTPKEYTSGVPPVIDDPMVQVMAAGLNVSPAQLLIRYQIDSGRHVVVKSSSAAHLWDNLQTLQTSLEPAQVKALHALNKNKRIYTFVGIGDTHRNYPFRIPF